MQILQQKTSLKRKILLFVLVFLIGFTLLLFNTSRWIAERSGIGSFEQVIFTMRAPSIGTSPDVLWDFVWSNVPSVIFALVFAVLLFVRSFKWEQKKQRFLLWGVSLGILVFSVVIFNFIQTELHVQAFLENQQITSTFIEDHYVDPRAVELTFPDEPRNLIYIYLESMETTFMHVDDGGAFEIDLIPELTVLAHENTNFSPTDRLGGAFVTLNSTWTSAGMFAQTAGLPLNVPVRADSALQDALFLGYEDVALFPSDIETLGDILDQQGYRQVLMMGSDASFGGRRGYFTENGNYEIWDHHTAIELGLLPEDYHVWWGFEDVHLFAFAQDKLIELAASDQPFNLTLLTADTHFEDGFLDASCDTPFSVAYANSLSCSSQQVYAFVRWIQQQPFYENTTIVLAGDHLSMQSTSSDFWEVFPVPAEYERTIYHVIINPAITPERTTQRRFTMKDLFPTTLASLGVRIEGERLGLGTNLFSNEPTLLEQYDLETLNTHFQRRSSFFKGRFGDFDLE